MPSHAYFLIDAGALGGNGRAAGVMIARILVYLAAKNEFVTWNYEFVDLRAHQRAATVQLRRKASERKQLTVDAMDGLVTALTSAKRHHGGAATHTRPILDALHERLMCLEADVEWEDPALIRSPTRNSSMRAWTDPTRLNESMSVRSHLYVLGQAPQTLLELDEFVCGSAAQNSQGDDHTHGATLLDKLTRMRDGIIGSGIWESYARKRVGVSWIRLTSRDAVLAADPVDILIGDIFSCCFEALGGCVMNMADLAANASLPFSSLFAPLHRTRTYPSWSRKFSREISAVVDRFAMEIARDDRVQADFESESRESREWLLQATSVSVRLTQINSAPHSWLRDGRLLRRYGLPEMVALASEYRLSCLRHQEWLSSTAKSLVLLGGASASQWHCTVHLLSREPILCSMDGHIHESLRNKVLFAQCPSHNRPEYSPTCSALYVAIVPVAECAAAVYFMNAATYSEMTNMLANVDDTPFTSISQPTASQFQAAWIEDWAWRDSAGDLCIVPRDHCALDVSFDESLFERPTLHQVPPDGSALRGFSADAGLGVMAQPETHTEPVSGVEGIEPTLRPIATLAEWYSEMYIKGLMTPTLEYGHILDCLALLCNTCASEGLPNTVFASLASSVLLSSVAIEDVFETVDPPRSAEELSDSETYRALRLKAAQSAGGDEPSKRAWQVRECQLQILLHLFAIDRLRLQQAGETSHLEESLRDLVDLLCVWASLDDIAIKVETDTTSINQRADKRLALTGGKVESTNDFAVAFVGGSHVGRFTGALGDIVEELRVQCGWIPPTTRKEQSVQCEHAELLPENKRRKGTPRKINKSSGDRSEVIVHQRKPTHRELSDRKLARHLDELIGGNKGQRHDDASSSEGGSSPSFRAVERRRQSLQPRMPAHLIRQLKSEVVLTSQRAPTATPASTRAGSNGFTCSIGSRTLGRSSSSARRKPLRRPVLSACPDSNRSPSRSSHVNDVCAAPEAALSKRRRTIMSIPMGSSPPAFLQSSLVTPSTFVCGSDDEEDGAPIHSLGSKRALQF
ncbi:hypothetical protein GGI20_000176 [Coemansia sp. BCRC 34301]|nr:hypothetical protein GGI20_000176 [Coemansia sp. BCRC 34301]